MFGLVGIEVTLCLFGDSDRVLAFVKIRHGARYCIAGWGGGRVSVGNDLIVCREKDRRKIGGGIERLMMSLIQS